MQKIQDYVKFVCLQYFLVTISRLYELYFVWKSHAVGHLFRSEIFGLINDIFLSNIFLLCLFPLYFVFSLLSKKVANALAVTAIILAFVLKILILQYFIFELRPLDIFLFQHTIKEVLFTIRTAEISYINIFTFFIFSAIAAITILKLFGMISFPVKLIYVFIVSALLSTPLYFLANNKLEGHVNNDLYINKAFYFYKACTNHFVLHKLEMEEDEPLGGISKKYRQLFNDKAYLDDEYPFMHKTNEADVLGGFFNQSPVPPNIVVLIVEGLADDFIHPYHGLNLMPFIDSLSGKSLYWDRFLSLGERSYAVTPSLIASLPYGDIGFTILEKQPYHFSLVNVLKANGYYTSFYYGQGAWFHHKDIFYNRNFIDRIIDKDKFSPAYPKVMTNNNDYFWGYNDQYLFRQSEDEIEKINERKRLDIYFTGTMHSPFIIEKKKYYDGLLDHYAKLTENKNNVEFYNKYRKYLTSVMFTNDALRDYFKWYKKRNDFNNTIFIITGDHPMTDIPISNSIKRYQVPLIIYSPLLKSPKNFHSVGSHLDVYEPLLTYLHHNYHLSVPPVNSAISSILDTGVNFTNGHPVVFMNSNRNIIDLYSNGYMLSDGKDLLKVDPDFKVTKVDDKAMFDQLSARLEAFRAANYYACHNDKLIPDSAYFRYIGLHACFFTGTSKKIHIQNEYQDIISPVKMKNEGCYFDISGNEIKGLNDELLVVCQLSNEKDSTLLWSSYGVPAKRKPFMYHLKLPKQEIKDSEILFRAYFLNTKKAEYEVKYKAALYQRGN